MTSSRCSRVLALACLHACVVFTGSGRAEEPDVFLRAEAKTLFDAARQQTAQGVYTAEVCAKFAESLRLDGGMGTRYYLADCYEHIGRYSSAWILFEEVAAEAKKAGLTAREEQARGRADTLRPKLTRISVMVSDDLKRLEGLEIRRNNVVLGPGQWGIAVPVDPGEHTISVEAKGKRRWSTTLTANGEGSTAQVVIPNLIDDVTAASSTASSGPAPSAVPITTAISVRERWTAAHTVGLVAAGLGAFGLGFGISFGVDAQNKVGAAKPECNDATPAVCTRRGSDLLDGAKVSGTISTIGFIGGSALVVGGLALFFFAPTNAKIGGKKQSAPVSAWIAPAIGNGAGFVAGGAW